MSLVIGILIIIILILLTFIISVNKELKYMSKQIKENLGGYHNIRTKMSYKYLDRLARNINLLYEENQKINIKRKDIEDELRKSISNMSHDLRTPLTSIMGYMQLIKSENIAKNEREDYINIVEKRTKTLQELISSFYELSRINGGEYKFHLKKINIKTILLENIALFYNDFTTNNIEPIIEIDNNIPDIISDESVIVRVFSNLISNVLKYGEKYVKISLKVDGNYIVSEFVNYANSLDGDEVNKIFNRFYTGNKSRTNESTGLGLSIVKSFVEELGNSIEARKEGENLVISIWWKIK